MLSYSEVVQWNNHSARMATLDRNNLDPADWPALTGSTSTSYTVVCADTKNLMTQHADSVISRRNGWKMPVGGGLKGGGNNAL